jgi:hypothetical protein
VVRFLYGFLPRYMAQCRVDFASLRPLEEEGRELPMKKRNDLLHVDAFPTRPTGGDMILRVFTNIHPEKPRVWLTSDPFREVARKYAPGAGLARIAAEGASPLGRLRQSVRHAARGLGLPAIERTAYDQFMLRFHDYLKQNREYQENCTKYRWEFAPQATWMAFTDVVPHAVLSGRYAVEQTFLIARDSLVSRRNAPIEILECVCGLPLGHVGAAERASGW